MATLAEIADHLDLSVRSVSALKRSGIIPAARRGAHDLGAARVMYIRHLRETPAGRAALYGKLDLTAERARLAAGQAEKVERENATAEGRLIAVGTACTARVCSSTPTARSAPCTASSCRRTRSGSPGPPATVPAWSSTAWARLPSAR